MFSLGNMFSGNGFNPLAYLFGGGGTFGGNNLFSHLLQQNPNMMTGNSTLSNSGSSMLGGNSLFGQILQQHPNIMGGGMGSGSSPMSSKAFTVPQSFSQSHYAPTPTPTYNNSNSGFSFGGNDFFRNLIGHYGFNPVHYGIR